MARANFVSFVENNISCNKYKSNHGTFINIYHDVELKLIINKYFLQREHSSSNSKSTTFIFLKRSSPFLSEVLDQSLKLIC